MTKSTAKTTVIDSKVLMTKEGLAEIKTEYDFFVNTRRKEVAERIKNAREFGDISETPNTRRLAMSSHLWRGELLS